MWNTEVSLLLLSVSMEFWKKMQKILNKTIKENSGKKKGRLQCSCGLGKAKDRVHINQFDYFMDTRKENNYRKRMNYDKIII